MKPDKHLTSFIDGLPNMDDASLLQTLARFSAAPEEYRPEAIAAATAEMERRALEPADLRAAMRDRVKELVDAIFDDARRLAEDGRTIDQIKAELRMQGVGEVSAAKIAKRAWDKPRAQRHKAGRRSVAVGAVLCLAGVVATSALYLVSTNRGRAWLFAVFSSLVLAGVLQCFRGIRQLRS